MPDWRAIVRTRLQPLELNPGRDSDMVEELAQHLEDLYQERVRSGESESEAYRIALAELDDVHPIARQIDRRDRLPRYDAVPMGADRRGSLLEDVWRDLRYAARSLRKAPLFACVAVLTLALGLGANATVFTLINTLILRPLPVPDAGELCAIGAIRRGTPGSSAGLSPVSLADLRDYQKNSHAFDSLAGYTSPRVLTLQNQGQPQGIFGELVTGNYFALLRLQPAMGRFFTPEEDAVAGMHPVAVLNHATWQTRFGGAADIIGRTLNLNGILFTIVGVAPPRFIGLNAVFGPDLWLPASMAERLFPIQMEASLRDRSKAAFQVAGRLQPGMSRIQAQAELTAVAASLAREYPESSDEGTAIAVRPIGEALFSSTTGSAQPVLFGSAVLLAVVGVVLLLACSNVANLLMARAATRRHEIAVRLAIGASQPRLIRQLLTESILLGLMSGAVGLLVSYATLRVLFSAFPGAANFVAPRIDWAVYLYAFVTSIATGILFGCIPAWRITRAGVAETLHDESRTAGRTRGKVTLANALLVGQIAFSFVLLVTAGLFLRSIGRAYQVDPGFETDHLAVFTTNPGQTGYDRTQTKTFYETVRERVAALPGVASVSWSSNMPLWARPVNGLVIEGQERRSRTGTQSTVMNTVDLHYFETAGIRIESGRDFTASDQDSSVPVAIVNAKFASSFWPQGNAIGKRIQVPGEKRMREIVGIARNASYTAWGEPPQNCVYLPLRQSYSDAMNLVVRSERDPGQILNAVRGEIQGAAPQILIGGPLSGREIIDRGLFQARLGVGLLSAFGFLALGLAGIGLYGVMAYSVTQRRREIGLRMALGAAAFGVLRMVLTQGLLLVIAGVTIGLCGALVVGRLLRSMLFGVSETDPVTVLAAATILFLAALLATFLPARRASRTDPLVALREG